MNPEDLKQIKLRRRNKLFFPSIIVFIGVILLLQRLPIDAPEWLFSWNIILIVIGILLGIKTRFCHWLWCVPLLIGLGRILASHYIAEKYHNLIFPIGLILFGCYIFFYFLFYKRSCSYYGEYLKDKEKRYKYRHSGQTSVDEDSFVRIENTFGGIDRSFISKNLKGGYIKNTFGGVNINLMQADFEGTIDIHIENTFGGITFYVPKNWKVVAKLDSHLSGIDDNSYFENQDNEDTKYMVLNGKSIFGGIEIKNFK